MNVRARQGRAGERGGISGGLLSLLVIGGLIYLAVVYVPAYAQYYEVKRITTEAAHMAINQRNDDALRSFISDRCADLGTYEATRDGKIVDVPEVDVDDEDIAIERDEDKPAIRIQVVYVKRLHFPFTSYYRPWRRVVVVKEDLKPVKW